MKKNWRAKFYIGSVSLVFCIVTMMQPFAVAYAESGVGRVENVAEGITVRQNWNGSKTLTMQLTDEQMEAMEPDDSDALLVDRGDAIISTSETVDAEINNDFKQNDELVTVAKDGTSISIAPIVDESNFEQENIPKSPDDLAGSEEAESAAPQNPEMPVNESEDPVQPETQEAGLTDITNEEAGNSLSPEATANGEIEAIPAPEAVQEAEAAENPTPEPTAEQAPAAAPTPEVSEPTAVPVSKEDSKPELRKEGYSGSAFESVTYEGVFDPSTDLRLKARENGIKEDIIINEYTENNVFEYRINLGGLVPRQEGQEILLSDSNGVNIARIAAPFMTDAAGAYSEDIAVSIRQDGSSYIIRYELSDSWLTPERAYPVIVDPSVYYDSVDAASLGLEDNYVSNTSPDTVNTYNREYFRVGNDTIAINQAYIRCVIPEDIVNKSSNILIQHAQVNMYETSGKTSGNTFSVHRVESSWNSRTITWNNSPHILDKAYDTQYVNGSGWYSWNLTEMFGEYFNTFNQVENCGFALVCDANDYGDYREFVSADTPSYRMTFSMTYFEGIPNTGIRVTPHTNGVNSGSGYFDVNWNSVEGAGGYYIGIWDGKEYEYLNVGNTTSFTTRGKGIWPTTAEINAGSCKLHLGGGGAELPMIPAHLYAKNNPGSSYANDLNYYFKVVPHNGTGQAPNPGLFSEAYGKLPDTMPPNKPSAVTVNPSAYTNAANITVSWSGLTDYNNASGSAQTTLSGGQIEYLIDSDSPAGAWKTTGKNTASGSYVFSTAGLKDGRHYIAIRGKDAAGNYGVHNYAYFYLDKTGPTAPVLSVTPASWTNNNTIGLSWSGITDLNNLKSVEYRLDNGSWVSAGKTDKAFNGLPVDITSLTDGEHTVSIHATDVVGNVGAAGTVKLYKDTTAPTVESITVDPDSWTISDTIDVAWTGLSDPHSGLARAEYSVAGGDWYDVLTPYVPPESDPNEPGEGEHGDVSSGEDDQNGFSLLADPFQFVQQPIPFIDMTNPQGLLSLFADPDGDPPPTLGETGNITAYLTGLPDGEHEIAFKVTDQLENQRTYTNTVYRDLTNPEIEILAPVDGDIANGMVEIWGSVSDLSLDEWTLSATGDSGKSVELARSTEEQNQQIIGVLNTGAFEDHEKIELTLFARDQAGNESLIEGIVLEVDKSAKPLFSDVTITAPEKGDKITVPRTSVEYTADYLPKTGDSIDSGETPDGSDEQSQGASQKTALYYIDGVFVEEKDDETSFDFDAITYPEGTSHTLTVISEDTGGQLHYSGGLGAAMLFADAFDNEDFTADKTNIDYAPSEAKLTDPSQDGEIVSVLSSTTKEIMALRLKATEETPGGTSIEYAYSIDGGHTWEPITTQTDIALKTPTKSVAVKAVLHGGGPQSPVLRAWQLEGVIEMSPVRVFSNLLREAKPFHITEPETVTLPAKEISTDLSKTDCVNQWLYEDGSLHADSFTYEAYKAQERTKHDLTAFAETKDGFIYASGMANTQLLLRENLPVEYEPIGAPDAGDAQAMPVPQGTVTSGKITAPSPVNVIRLDALADETDAGSIVYEYSLDNKSWASIDLNDNVALPKAAKEIYLRAKVPDGARLVSWHLEGFSGTEKNVEVRLVQPPVNVAAADYGKYYEDPAQRNYILTWENTNPKTETVQCAVFFSVYKNGKLVAEIPEENGTSCLDPEYAEGAAYEVSVKHIYGEVDGNTVTLYPHESLKTAAETILIPPPEKLDVVEFTANEYEQSQYLNDLYGGNYTFSTEPSPPKGERLLNEKLLGKNKYCAIGFEPINFNNGNFFMEQADFVYADVGSANLNIVRTYNAQSEMTDGPFGGGWDTDFAQHLILFQDGSYGYVKANGATVYFTPNGDGTYTGNDDDYLKFAVDEINHEISIEEPRGKTMVFTTTGLLKSIITDETNVTKIERDGKGLMTAVIAPSGARLGVTMDTGGHITEITLPGGAVMQYEYSGTDLVSFTDADGNTKRYVYDGQHRMTEWYDGNGVQQVFNEYDEKNRVVFQTDAQAGEYHLEYSPDHTITTDAQGQKTEVWFDDQKRVVKQVDAKGNETLTSYDEDGNVSGITQPDGTLTAYEYDSNGNKTKEISPDGSFVSFVYNEDNLPVEFTDKAGNVTKYEYDENGNPSKQINPDGSVVQFQYNAYGQKILEIDAVGNETEYRYEGANLVETIDAKGGVTKLAYDLAGHLTSKIDASGMVTKYEYDAAGNNTKIVFADGTFMAYEYDGAGNQIAAVNPKGEVTRMEYDGMNQLIKTILPDGSVQQAEYDFNGNVKKVSNALGETATYEYDANGNVTAQTDAAGNRTTFEYDSMNRMTAQINAAGARTVYVYDELTGKVAKAIDADGNETQFQYDANGNQVKQINPDGTTVTTEYDSLNRPVKTTDANGGVSTIEYNPDSSIAATIDATGAKTTFAYDANGNVTKETDALGNSTQTEYDAAGKIISVTNQNGGVFRYEYDQAGQLAKTVDPLGNTEEYEYDQAANLIKTIDVRKNSMRFEYDENGQQMGAVLKNGGKTHTEYDGAGRVTKQTDALGNSTQYEYNANGQATKVTDAKGNSVTMEYDSLGNTVKTTGPNGISIENEYDETGRLLKTINEQGLVTEYTYDSMNRVTAQTVNAKTTEYAYDGNGNVKTVTDAQGNELKMEYDKANRLTHIIYPDGTSDQYKYDELGRVSTLLPRQGMPTQYTYDAVGNILTEQNGDRITTYEYDAMGNMTAKVNPDGSKISYAYDAAGNMVSQTDALGNVTQVSYDAMDWAEKIAYADGSSYENKYDLGGNVIQKTDAENAKTTFEYDAAGNVTKTTDALGNTVSYEYDALGSLTKVTDALSHATEYEYDSQGNLLSETDALGNVKKYEYTPEGWLTKITNPDGTVTTYTYDELGQMTGEDYNGEKQVSHTYNELGLVTEMTGPEGTSKYQYDDQSQLISVSGASGDVVGYSYDDYGRKTEITYPDGRRVSYRYDEMDRLVEVRGLDGGKTTYEYDANGNRIKTKSGGIQTEYGYDAMNRVVSQRASGETDISFAYEYDKNGYITGETRTEGETVYTRDYGYDPLGQITSFKENDYSEKYTYDAAGNMTQKVANGVKSEMAYNAANQLTKLTSANGAVNYTYDANGNLTAKTLNGKTSTYAYDAAGKLTDYLGYDGYEEKYTYDAAGNRIEKKSRGTSARKTLEELAELGEKLETETSEAENPDEWITTEYVNDINTENAQVLMERTGGRTVSYEYGLERLSMYAQEGLAERKTDYVYDGRGSVAQEISYNNAWYNYLLPFTQDTQVKGHRYTPFGEQMTGKATGFGYNGEYYSAETGMQYLQMRYYEPDMMRFSQKDIIQMQGAGSAAMNRYAYAANNPVNFSDPSGMFFEQIGDFFGAIAEGAAWLGGKIVEGAGYIAGSVVGVFNKDAGDYIKNSSRALGNQIADAGKSARTTLRNSGAAKDKAISTFARNISKGKSVGYAASKARSSYNAYIQQKKAEEKQRKTNVVKNAFPGYDVAYDGDKVGIMYNGAFVEITSPEQAQAIKACMDDLEREKKNQELEKARADVAANKADVVSGPNGKEIDYSGSDKPNINIFNGTIFDSSSNKGYSQPGKINTALGYGDVYEVLGKAVVDINTSKSRFEYNGQEYLFQHWQGNYMANLPSVISGTSVVTGIEAGIYRNGEGTPTWGYGRAEPEDKMDMNLTLFDKNGNSIINVDSRKANSNVPVEWQYGYTIDGHVQYRETYSVTTISHDDFDFLNALKNGVTDGVAQGNLEFGNVVYNSNTGKYDLTYTYDPYGLN